MMRRTTSMRHARGELPPVPRRRVVVTGMGCVTPLGCDVATTWAALLAGKSAGRPLSEAPYFVPASVSEAKKAAILEALPCKVGCPVITPDALTAGGKDPFAATNSEPRYTRFAKHAAAEALRESGLVIVKDADAVDRGGKHGPNAIAGKRIGVNVGIGMTPLHDVGEVAHHLYDPAEGAAVRYNKISPFFVPKILGNMAAGAVGIATGARGPLLSSVTACATGAHCIGEAALAIQMGHADAMICGAAESALNGVGIAGFARMRALSTKYNDTPQTASRPFDTGRDGFVMGEGGGALVLEALDSAVARGATILAEVRGYGCSGDANHISAPRQDGDGGYSAILAALADGGVAAAEVGYVNAHATSTPVGDGIELDSLTRLFGGSGASGLPVAVSSSKGGLGHLLGAAGAVEAIATILALRDRLAPPTANLSDPVEAKQHGDAITLVRGAPLNLPKLDAAVSSSFGFGGTNAALLFTAL